MDIDRNNKYKEARHYRYDSTSGRMNPPTPTYLKYIYQISHGIDCNMRTENRYIT